LLVGRILVAAGLAEVQIIPQVAPKRALVILDHAEPARVLSIPFSSEPDAPGGNNRAAPAVGI
jgi:hypothetical protein